MTTTLDPRPSPTQVHAWLAADFSDDALRALVAVLSTDPNWRLRAHPGLTTWDGDLRYSPHGLSSHVHLVRHPPTPPPSPAAGIACTVVCAPGRARPGYGPLSPCPDREGLRPLQQRLIAPLSALLRRGQPRPAGTPASRPVTSFCDRLSPRTSYVRERGGVSRAAMDRGADGCVCLGGQRHREGYDDAACIQRTDRARPGAGASVWLRGHAVSPPRVGHDGAADAVPWPRPRSG